MALFAAGIAALALLLATYTTRRNWLAWGSAVLSLVAIAGGIFLATAKDPAALDRYVRLADRLAPVLDRQTIDDIASAVRRVASYKAPISAPTPANAGRTLQAAVASVWPEPKPETKRVSGDPIAWLLEESVQVPTGAGDRFRIGGVNVTDQALTGVRGLLKPDGGTEKLRLALDIEDAQPGDAVIPPGARFSLALPKDGQDGAGTSGGAILTFRYELGGQKRTVILYLDPPLLAQLSAQ